MSVVLKIKNKKRKKEINPHAHYVTTEIQNVPMKIEFKQMLTYDIISTLDG